MVIQIRSYQDQDFDRIIELWAKTNLHMGPLETRDTLKEVMRRNPTTFLIAVIENRIVGVIMGTFDGRRAYVYKFGVDPQVQHQHIGTRLVEALLTEFETLGVKQVMGFISTSNPKIMDFYKQFGAEIRTDVIPVGYNFPTGKKILEVN